ncbi:MAG: alpha/beta hydrolase [Rickettsiales bacterium]|jgi:alpha/beta superfamily hydrolase|nr:alpha/beta hydrolase [Rickettsiales bacterium]
MDITLSGGAGRIAASFSQSANPNAPIAVVFHDAPALGGSMNDPVAYTLFYAFRQNGFSVIRFNFRGAGGTEGEFENGEAELSDASAVVDWIQEKNEDARGFWLAGEGFGAWVAAQMLMRRVEVTNYIAIAPPAKKYDWSFFAPVPVDGLVLGAAGDPLSPEESINNFARAVNRQRAGRAEVEVVPCSSHRFDGCLKELYSAIDRYIKAKI